jgi:hypothetical protein
MRPAAPRREHVREEEPLRDLDPLLVAEGQRTLRGYRFPRRDEPGDELGRRVDEVLVTDCPAEIVGQRRVEILRVRAQEA